MPTPIAAAKEYVDALAAATGLRVVLKPSAANPPCVIIEPPTVQLSMSLGGCTGRAQWTAYAVAPGVWNTDAWAKLDEIVAAVIAADVIPVGLVEPSTHSTDRASDMPAMRLTWTGHVQWTHP